jgi:hypothetical protein
MTDYILYGFTILVAGLMVGIRYRDYLKHKKVLQEVSEKSTLFEVVTLRGTKIMLYLFVGITLAFTVMAFFYNNYIQSATYIFVFILMGISEWINILTVGRVSVFDRAAVYGSYSIRLKSIRTVVPQGKKNMRISMLDNTSFTVPNEVGEKMIEILKTRKAK